VMAALSDEVITLLAGAQERAAPMSCSAMGATARRDGNT
jgi:hypothetical protein